MHWRTRNEAHLHKAKKFFTENNFDYDKQTISNLPTDVYQKRYDDGWVFRCELIWEL
uniref:Uncharacterized protein n=1 Tax=Acrobeloides nanus TaxID=290746 RepID=A0A914E9L7_9BILA